jgi:protocatechuate 3,4-dioxygenase beta subunit
MEKKPRKAGLRIAAVAALVLAVLLVCWLAIGRNDEEAIAEPDAAATELEVELEARGGSEPAPLELTTTVTEPVIRGSIRDPEGAAIPNAQVCAVSDAEARDGLDDRKPHCVRSGPDGRYAIGGLLPIATAVHASAPSFKPARWLLREGPGWPRAFVSWGAERDVGGIDLILEPGGVLLRGVIKDIAGEKIEGAWVGFSQFGGGAAYTSTDENGEFEQWVAPGGIALYADAEGYTSGGVEAVAPGKFVELFMTPESVLVGRVVLAGSGEPVAGALVSAGRSHRSSYTGPTTTRTDAEGRFRIDRLEPGSYKPTAETDTLWGEAGVQAHLGFGATSEPLLIRVHPTALVAGRVVIAGSERPCPGGSVNLERHDDQTWADINNDEGRVEFRGVWPGTYQVRVYCPDFVAAEHYPDIVVAGGVLDGLVWEVQAGLSIRGIVVDAAGERAANVELTASPVYRRGPRPQKTHSTGLSKPDGSFELTGLHPDRYEILTLAWRGRSIPSELPVVELPSGADLDDVRVVLPPLGHVRGRVIDETGKPVSGVVIGASPVRGLGSGRGFSNDAGEFEIDNLSVGQTRVTAIDANVRGRSEVMRKPGTTDDELPGEVVEIVANEFASVTLTVEARDARITGVVSDGAGGPVANAFIDVEHVPERKGRDWVSEYASARWSWDSQPILTDSDGRFELEGLPEAGKFIIRANRKGGGDVRAEGVLPGSHIELVLAETGELGGKVVVADGSAPERFTISAEDKAQGILLVDSFFRTDGIWRLTAVPAGSYVIIVTSSLDRVTLEPAVELGAGEARKGIEIAAKRLELAGGETVELGTGPAI